MCLNQKPDGRIIVVIESVYYLLQYVMFMVLAKKKKIEVF
jgi:hypothetical protein